MPGLFPLLICLPPYHPLPSSRPGIRLALLRTQVVYHGNFPITAAHATPHHRHGKLTCTMSDTMPSTPTSEASTKVDNDSTVFHDENKGFRRRALYRAKEAATSRDILLFLVAFRILNALSIRTFFQPDEYFQSLEPAWQIVFGEDSGAWTTWVCMRRKPRRRGLTAIVGMETPPEILDSSIHVRCSILDCVVAVKKSTPWSGLPCRADARRSKAAPILHRCRW